MKLPGAVVVLMAGCLARNASSTPKIEDVIDEKKCIINRVGYAKVKFGMTGDAGFSEALLDGDVDRDGARDYLVKLIGAPTTVFASNNGCLRDLGDVHGTIVALVEPESDATAPRNVLTFRSAGCGGLAGTLLLFTLNGRDVIPPQTVATCQCPDLSRPDPGRHEMCPAVRPM